MAPPAHPPVEVPRPFHPPGQTGQRRRRCRPTKMPSGAKLTDATVAPTMPVHVLGHFNSEMLRQIAAPIGDAGDAFVQA